MKYLAPPPEFDLPPASFELRRQHLIAEVAAAQADRTGQRLFGLRGGGGRPRLRLVAVAAALAVALVPAALGVGALVKDAFDRPTSPTEAAERTGEPAREFGATTYEGERYAVLIYRDGSGRVCLAHRAGAAVEGGGIGYSCRPESELFWARQRGPARLVRVEGPISAQAFADATEGDLGQWDRMWFFGLAKPEVSRLEVQMTDCTTRALAIDGRFEGNGVFLYTVPVVDLHGGVWPHRLLAYDARGQLVETMRLHTSGPSTEIAPPTPDVACR